MARDASNGFAPAGIAAGGFFLALLEGLLLLLRRGVAFSNEGAKLLSQHSVSFLNFSEFRVEFPELGRAGNDGLIVDFPKDAIVVGDSGLNLGNVPVVFTDMAVFKLWDLHATPTIMLGIDLLTQFETVALDFGRSSVRFDISNA